MNFSPLVEWTRAAANEAMSARALRSAASLRLLLDQQDARVLAYVMDRRRPGLDRVMRGVTRLGDPVVVIALALLILLIPDSSLGGAANTTVFAVIVSHLLVQLLKRTITRPRPELPVGMTSLIEAPDRFSFPSGHAAASLSLALGIAPAMPPLVRSFAIAFSLLVGISRCYLGVHYPGDVIVGWVLAVLGVALSSLL
jgi:undecaprenyl-diphosphatase